VIDEAMDDSAYEMNNGKNYEGDLKEGEEKEENKEDMFIKEKKINHLETTSDMLK
jgi:hypothetical protein